MQMTEPAWDYYRSFLAVLRAGSFSGAARQLGLRQSTIGRQIEALEESLGVTLFTRSPRGLNPTEAALKLRPHLDVLASTAASLVRDANSASSGLGTVRITTSATLGFEILPHALADMRGRFPNVAVEISLSDDFENLLSRQADLAIRSNSSEQQAIVQQKVGAIEMGLFASRAYMRGRKLPESPDDLRTHAVIGYDRDLARLRALQTRLPAFDRDAFSYATDTIHLHKSLVDAGCGIGFCLVDRKRTDRIRILPDSYSLRFSVWVAMHEDLKSNRTFRALFRALAQSLKIHLA